MIGTPREVRKESAVVVVCNVRVNGDVTMRLTSCAIGRAWRPCERAGHWVVSPRSVRGGSWIVKSRERC